MTFKKCQIKYFIIILIAMSAFNVPTRHSICHIRFFCYWIDGKDQNKINNLKSRTDLGAKSI